MLVKAIGLVRQIGAESRAPQLARQLAAFEGHARRFEEGATLPDDPVALVAAEEVVPSITSTWAALSNRPPEKVTVVSPFWPEGSTATEAMVGLVRRLGGPASVELGVSRGAVCRRKKVVARFRCRHRGGSEERNCGPLVPAQPGPTWA